MNLIHLLHIMMTALIWKLSKRKKAKKEGRRPNGALLFCLKFIVTLHVRLRLPSGRTGSGVRHFMERGVRHFTERGVRHFMERGVRHFMEKRNSSLYC